MRIFKCIRYKIKICRKDKFMPIYNNLDSIYYHNKKDNTYLYFMNRSKYVIWKGLERERF